MSSSYPNKTRPFGAPPIWASVELMVDVGQPWDGEPTKIRPSAGLLAAGWLPNEQPPPERLNWLENDQGRRQEPIDMIEARTFVEPIGAAGTGGTTAGVGNAVGAFAGARWQAVETIFHATNSTKIQKSINGGYTWADTLTVASAVFSGIATRETAAKAGGTAASYTLTGVAKVALTGGDVSTNNAWASTTLTGSGVTNTAECVIADPYVANVFLVGGKDFTAATDRPTVWRVTAALGLFSAQQVVAMGSPNIGPAVSIIAASPTKKLAVGVGVTTTIWTWSDGDTTATLQTSPTTDLCKSVVWLPHDEKFLMITDSGAGVRVWTSADGSTGSWTEVNLPAGGCALFAAATTYTNGACARGSIVMVPLLVAGIGHIAISGDAGATWEIIADPIARHSAAKVVQRICDLGPRFIAAGYNAASEVLHALTLRAG